MVPPDLGEYTVDVRPRCGGKEFGGGVPMQDWSTPQDNFDGIASKQSRPMQQLATEQGHVRLAWGPTPQLGFMPTWSEIRALIGTDTRRTAISDRYYK
tara:strand:+ start:764 stop:1057 length:294 start_codon:yes stop_codon:yes gene_type:complete